MPLSEAFLAADDAEFEDQSITIWFELTTRIDLMWDDMTDEDKIATAELIREIVAHSRATGEGHAVVHHTN